MLEGERSAVDARDDLSVELAQLHTATGGPEVALELLRARRFQPWEGGEGQVLSAWDEALLALARRALDDGDGQLALEHVGAALEPVASLGEARHPLANTAQLHLMLGDALAATGDDAGASAAWSQRRQLDGRLPEHGPGRVLRADLLRRAGARAVSATTSAPTPWSTALPRTR